MAKAKDKYKETLGKFAFGVLLFVVWIFLCASVLSYSPSDAPSRFVYSGSEQVANLAGLPGAWCAHVLFSAFGVAAYFVLIAFGVSVLFYWRQGGVREPAMKTFGFALILVAAAGAAAFLVDASVGPPIGPGGCAGAVVKYLLENYFVRFGSYLALLGVLFAGGVLAGSDGFLRFVLWSTGIGSALEWASAPFRRKLIASKPRSQRPERRRSRVARPYDDDFDDDFDDDSAVPFVRRSKTPRPATNERRAAPLPPSRTRRPERPVEPEPVRRPAPALATISTTPNDLSPRRPERLTVEPRREHPEPVVASPSVVADANAAAANAAATEPPKRSLLSQAFGFGAKKRAPEPVDDVFDNFDDDFDAPPKPPRPARREYVYPSLDFLAEPERYDLDALHDAIIERGAELERVCASFGVELKVVDAQPGPVLTLYEIELKKGLRVNKLTVLSEDLAIAMKAPRVRVVSPIPGKNTVGIEIPNQNRQLVRLREVMEECAAQAEKMAIPIFLGKDVGGAPMVADLAKLPHLLIAGRTGTGKSVCLNSIIMSILMTRSPEEVKLIMIDPKMVELSPYKTVPHLMHPVVVDMQKAEAILEWAVEKMEQRYQLFAAVGARKLSEFNAMPEATKRKRLQPRDEEEWAAFPKTMSSVVIIADEMADMIMTSGKDVERHIVRLAQKSRAVGIHLVLATQKPTVDVVTGLIKSNLPARIAFGVASRTDSQVVLDAKGAEQLLGNGDMLFLLPGTSQLVRGQGAFVSDKEIDAVIESISVDEPEYEFVVPDQNAPEDEERGEIEYDSYYVAAVDAVIAEGSASTSFLQRKFSIGYGRAARLIDTMTAEGIISPKNPAKPSRPRDILITMEQWRGRDAVGPSVQAEVVNAPLPYTAPPVPRADGDVAAYRSTSYDATPVSTPTERAAERSNAAQTTFDEIDLSPVRDAASSGREADANASRGGGSGSGSASGSSNPGWNDEQWAKYLDYGDELDEDGDDYGGYDGARSGGNLREKAKSRRERKRGRRDDYDDYDY
ncbi:MAG: DNA translocase FtsK [Thermoguttaceae bacterium]|nr:DNA translocase FtsK [Thermoguttaceae bacterium]